MALKPRAGGPRRILFAALRPRYRRCVRCADPPPVQTATAAAHASAAADGRHHTTPPPAPRRWPLRPIDEAGLRRRNTPSFKPCVKKNFSARNTPRPSRCRPAAKERVGSGVRQSWPSASRTSCAVSESTWLRASSANDQRSSRQRASSARAFGTEGRSLLPQDARRATIPGQPPARQIVRRAADATRRLGTRFPSVSDHCRR